MLGANFLLIGKRARFFSGARQKSRFCISDLHSVVLDAHSLLFIEVVLVLLLTFVVPVV